MPGATPVPQRPAGTVPGGNTQDPIREPNIPQFEPKPLPPVPSMNVHATQMMVETTRNGMRRGAWSVSAPSNGATQKITAIERLLAYA